MAMIGVEGTTPDYKRLPDGHIDFDHNFIFEDTLEPADLLRYRAWKLTVESTEASGKSDIHHDASTSLAIEAPDTCVTRASSSRQPSSSKPDQHQSPHPAGVALLPEEVR